MATVVLTKKEQQAISELKALARRWPSALSLFSWNGSLCVFKHDSDGCQAQIDIISGIHNDGGDPAGVNQSPDVKYK